MLLHEAANAVEKLGYAVRGSEVHGRDDIPAYRATPCEHAGAARSGRPARTPPPWRSHADQRGQPPPPRMATTSLSWIGAAVRRRRRRSELRSLQEGVRGRGTGLRHQHVAGPRGEEVGHVEPGAATQDARHTLLEQDALDQLGLGLVAPAGDPHELALRVGRVDLPRAGVGVAERLLQRRALRTHERRAALGQKTSFSPVRVTGRAGERRLSPRRRGLPPPPTHPRCAMRGRSGSPRATRSGRSSGDSGRG